MDNWKILKKSWKLFLKNNLIQILSLILGTSGALSTIVNIERYSDSYIQNFALGIMSYLFLGLYILLEIGIVLSVIEKQQKVSTLLTLLQSGRLYFWRVIGISFLGAIAPAIFIVAVTFYLFSSSSSASLVCLIPLLVIFFPFAFVIHIVAQLATVKVISEDRKVAESFKQSWRLATKNQWGLLKLGAILFVVSILSTVLARVRIFLQAQLDLFGTGPLVSVFVWIVYVLLLAIIFGFTQVSWTQAYLTLARKKR